MWLTCKFPWLYFSVCSLATHMYCILMTIRNIGHWLIWTSNDVLKKLGKDVSTENLRSSLVWIWQKSDSFFQRFIFAYVRDYKYTLSQRKARNIMQVKHNCIYPPVSILMWFPLVKTLRRQEIHVQDVCAPWNTVCVLFWIICVLPILKIGASSPNNLLICSACQSLLEF